MSAAPIPQKLVEYIAQTAARDDGYRAYSVVPVEGVTLGGAGIDLPRIRANERRLQLSLAAARSSDPDDIIIDDYYADQNKARVGDIITLLEFEMARLRHHGERQARAHRVPHRYPAGAQQQPGQTSTRSM